MENSQQNKYNNFGEKSTGEDLERALDNPSGVGDSAQNKQGAEKKIFVQRDEFLSKEVKKRLFKDLDWYWKIIKKPVKILAGLEILLYILAIVPALRLLMLGVFDPILLLVDFVFFAWLVWQVRIKKQENLWQAVVTVFLAGFALGLVVSIFKAIWIREYWTIFNLITEPVFMGLLAVAVGLIVSLVIKPKN
jgi:hypothetical protein